MKIGIPKEIQSGENRVAITPKIGKRLVARGFELYVETGAGKGAQFTDQDYETCGTTICNTKELYENSDIILKVQPPTEEEIGMMKAETLLLSYIYPGKNQELLAKLSEAKINAIAMDAIPRISRAQKLDVLSSMANIAGYRAVVEASNHFGRFLNGQITAAGKIEPAKVLVIGAGVAGLAAIGAAKSMGAIVRAFDTRKEVAEQIKSMGAEFISVEIDEDGSTESGYSKEMSQAFIDAEMELFLKQATEVDIIITTAQIPGKEAPKLILDYHVLAMRAGSIIVDLAASTGGNCTLTKVDEIYTTPNGVTILGKVDQLPTQASFLYGNNLYNMLDDMGGAENFHIDMEDDIIKRAMVSYQGNINWPPEPLAVSPTAVAPCDEADKIDIKKTKKKKNPAKTFMWLGIIAIFLYILGQYAPAEFMGHFTAFVLAVFVGWNVIWNVTHALHTPLMSVTNAISGIIIIGGLLQISDNIFSPISILAFIAILIASINIVGGFTVTYRMLKMFKK
ncbi:MAG: Re/Si-specific NAD(P)(+) transhydrogenase subunit alpha [Bacteroidales bacterium]|jgi:NAD(P) transhydrogenase subunit alpha|nr:Re/Si-specific NAD(P)(+) transhydrogenase subunit alpha [Bacteroidales bacterium]